MNRPMTVLATLTLTAGLALAQADKTKPSQPAAQPSEAEIMEQYTKAAMPGPQHARLMKACGVWDGKMKSRMMPDAPMKESACTSTITPMFDGRYTKYEMQSSMPDMPGPFLGFGLYAFDNATQKYQMTWIDNMSTCMMPGTGEASADGKTITWNMSYTDPVTKALTTMRQTDRLVDDNHAVMEMYGNGPDGKEFKMMEVSFTRKAGSAAPAVKPAPSK